MVKHHHTVCLSACSLACLFACLLGRSKRTANQSVCLDGLACTSCWNKQCSYYLPTTRHFVIMKYCDEEAWEILASSVNTYQIHSLATLLHSMRLLLSHHQWSVCPSCMNECCMHQQSIRATLLLFDWSCSARNDPIVVAIVQLQGLHAACMSDTAFLLWGMVKNMIVRNDGLMEKQYDFFEIENFTFCERVIQECYIKLFDCII